MNIARESLEKLDDLTYSSSNLLVRWYFWSRLTSMVRVAGSPAPGLILDIGCGRGELLRVLTKEFSHSEFLAVDLGDDIFVARRRIKGKDVRSLQFVRADVRLLPLRSCCSQLVFCASVLEHLPDVLPAILEMRRILGRGGRLVVGVPTENRVYHIARKLAGFRKPADHHHQGTLVDKLLRDKLDLSISRKLPFSLLPRFLALYLVSVYEKERKPTSVSA